MYETRHNIKCILKTELRTRKNCWCYQPKNVQYMAVIGFDVWWRHPLHITYILYVLCFHGISLNAFMIFVAIQIGRENLFSKWKAIYDFIFITQLTSKNPLHRTVYNKNKSMFFLFLYFELELASHLFIKC